MRCFRLLRWASRTAIAKVLHLLRAQGAAGVDRLNRALLVGERWLYRRRWGLVDERARLAVAPDAASPAVGSRRVASSRVDARGPSPRRAGLPGPSVHESFTKLSNPAPLGNGRLPE